MVVSESAPTLPVAPASPASIQVPTLNALQQAPFQQDNDEERQ